MEMRRRLTQEIYDETVANYTENFDMDAFEARESALEELKLQDFDVSMVSQPSCFSRNTVAREQAQLVLSSLRAILEMEEKHTEESMKEGVLSRQQILALILAARSSATDHDDAFLRVIGQSGANKLLLQISCKITEAAHQRDWAFECLEALMVVPENSQLVLECQEFSGVLRTLSTSESSSSFNNFVASAMKHQDDNKTVLLQEYVLDMLSRTLTSDDELMVQSASRVLISILLDGVHTVASRKHTRALILFEHGIVRHVCAGIYRCSQLNQYTTLLHLLELLTELLVNERACRSVEVDIMRVLLDLSTSEDSALLLHQICKCVRRLVMCDSCKISLLNLRIIDVFVPLLDHDTPWLEEIVGTIAALTLRNQSAACTLYETDGINKVLKIMQHDRRGKVLRQCCVLIRNVANRNETIKVSPGISLHGYLTIKNVGISQLGQCRSYTSFIER